MDDGSNGDIDLDLDADAGWSSGPSQSVQLGVTFFAIAVILGCAQVWQEDACRDKLDVIGPSRQQF